MIHSIFLRISIFFIIVFIAISIGFFAFHQSLSKDQNRQLEKDAEALLLALRQSITLEPSLRHIFLQEHGYTVAKPHQDLIQPLHNAFDTIPISYPEAIKSSLQEGRIKILKDDRHLYIYLTKATPPLLIIKSDVVQQPYPIEILFVSFSAILIFLYWVIIRTLFPLKRLIQTINRYGTEGIYTPISHTGKDEISLVSRALDTAMEKNQALLEARKLFLRNIMHELKTPITVGKLALPFLKKGEEKVILERAFFRMGHLISELVRLEQITSGALAPHLQTCDPTILIDKAKALLFLKEDLIDIAIDGTQIIADMDVMVTVFKNLIDNGIKYSPDGKVKISQTGKVFLFCNLGNPWPDGWTFQTLSEPFSHQYDIPNSFGLGLYIIKSIMDAHNFSLTHYFQDGVHCFKLVCSNSHFSLD
jgi:two-component system, OmpR family, sensor kinase